MAKADAGQASLFGDAPETIERLIVALMLPPEAAQKAGEVLSRSRADHGLGGKGIDGDRLHVTLVHVGDYANRIPPRVIEEAKAALDALSASAFDIAFDRAGSFAGSPGRHPHVLLGDEGVRALDAFRRGVWEGLVRAGVKMLSRREFNPHVTLAYGDARLPERPIEPVRWRASEVLLIHSEYGRTRYNELGRWALSG